MDAIICNTCNCIAIISYCILFVQVKYPISHTVQSNPLSILTWSWCWNQSCIHHHFITIFYTSLISINIVAIKFFYVNFCASTILLKISSTSCLIFCNLKPFSFIFFNRILWGCRWVWTTCSQTDWYNQKK